MFSDIRRFLLHRPAVPTHIVMRDAESRAHYGERVRKHLGVNVHDHAVFNVHRIGLDVPVDRAYAALRDPEVVAACWPNHLARFAPGEQSRDHVRLYFLGIRRLPLFDLTRVAVEPGPDGRYLLYRSSGGYPIGFFSMYVRPSIAELHETGATQLFFVVGFDFYGKRHWTDTHFIHRVWKKIHNRATANILNRFKQLCESKSVDAQAVA